MIDAGGRWGMLVAIGVLLVLGSGVCIGHRKAGTALIAGGVIVSLTQIFPLPHIVAGMIGLELADKAGMIDDAVKLPSILGGFVVTFVTGGLLIALAGAIGAIVHLVRDWSRSE